MNIPGENQTAQTIVLGTRKSRLALWQTHHVRDRLQSAYPNLEFHIAEFDTAGDRNLSQPLPEIGGKGLFTAELDQAIQNGKIHLAIHSLKDLPTQPDPGMATIPILVREDPRDVLVSNEGLGLSDLPAGAVVGTSSPRRQAQLLSVRPDLTVQSIRGNVPTRIKKVREGLYDATVLAAAGVLRIGLQDEITEYLSDDFLPAPGQGCLGATCLAADQHIMTLLDALVDEDTRRAVEAERWLLHFLGGGCSAPIASRATVENGTLKLKGKVSSLDGSTNITCESDGKDAKQVAHSLAENILAAGGQQILTEVFPLKDKRVVLTRSSHQAGLLEKRLGTLGATPLSVPSIEIRAMDDIDWQPIFDSITQYSKLILTSANAATCFFENLPASLHQPELFQKVICIGPKTWNAVLKFGDCPETRLTRHDSATLISEVSFDTNDNVLFPCAKNHLQTIPEFLKNSNIQTTVFPIYETVPRVIPESEKSYLNSGFDLILFASPSAVSSICEQVAIKTIQSGKVVCIGPTTKKRAEDLGLTVDIMPDEYTVDGMLKAIVGYVQTQGSSQ